MKKLSRKHIAEVAAKRNMAVLKMDDAVYALRRRVIDCIYSLKREYALLPRIEVRIVEDHETCLAYAFVGSPVVRISKRAVACNDYDLYTIVAHEVLHTLGFKGHDEKCPLMRAIHKPLPRAQVNELFAKHAQRLARTAKAVA